jgi:hypothetical protein
MSEKPKERPKRKRGRKKKKAPVVDEKRVEAVVVIQSIGSLFDSCIDSCAD